jgi:hypothetical protein
MAEMGAMNGQTKAFDVTDNLSISDSDGEPLDDQEALGRKVSQTVFFLNIIWASITLLWMLTLFE